VQFFIDGSEAGQRIKLVKGSATYETARLHVGQHVVSARYMPNDDSEFLPSTSLDEIHIVRRCPCGHEGREK